MEKKTEKDSETKTEEKKPKTQPVKVTASSDLASNLESLHEKLEKLEKTVERLRRRTPSVFGRFLSDIAKVIILAALVAVAWQTGLIDRFLEWATSLDLDFGGASAEETVPNDQ